MAPFNRILDLPGQVTPGARRTILGVAVIGLIAGVAVSLRHRPEIFEGLHWWPIVALVFIGYPVNILLNAIEFAISGRLIGRFIRFATALEVTIISSAANLLPLPGGPLVRIAALKAAGARYREGTEATLFIAGLWVGIACAFAGVSVLALNEEGFSAAGVFFLSAGGAVIIIGMVIAARRGMGLEAPLLALGVKTSLVATDVLRFYLCLLALGAEPSLFQTSMYAVSSAAAAAVSVVPAGLGVREGLSAALAPLVGLDAALGFLGAVLDRILGLAVLVMAALLTVLAGRRQPS